MITCEAARELLLEAEPAELRAEGEGALAAHLRGCPGCRHRAAFILAETQVLRSAMDAVRPPLHAVERGPGGEAYEAHAAERGSGGEGVRRRWRVLVPVALAAGIAALVLVHRPDITQPRGAPLQLAAATPGALDVQVPPGQSVAVFQTANPNIVIVWSYRTGRQ